MVQRLTTEDIEALQLRDAFSAKQQTEGAIAGAGVNLGGAGVDFLSKIFSADLADTLGRRTLRRAKDLDAAAGAGADERIEAARGQKTALARDAVKAAATAAAQDPTGAGAIEFARQAPSIVKRSADVSKEQTAEQEQQLKQAAFAEQIRRLGEDQRLAAKQGKQQARLGLVKDVFEGAGKLAQSIAPPTLEAKLSAQEKRQGLKQERLTGKALKKFKAGDVEAAQKFRERAQTAGDTRAGLKQDLDALTIAEFKKTQAKAGATAQSTQNIQDFLAALQTSMGASGGTLQSAIDKGFPTPPNNE
jgi:hypothetical protein